MAAARLIAGDIDAAFIVTAWDSPVVQRLINAKGVVVASWSARGCLRRALPLL